MDNNLTLQKFLQEGKCLGQDFMQGLQNLLKENFTQLNHTIYEMKLACVHNNQTAVSIIYTAKEKSDLAFCEVAMDFYGYITPIIFLIGIIGNSLSLRVFLSKPMRKMSACYYLAALAASDIGVLLTYVLLDWLSEGLSRWPGGHKASIINYDGLCHTFLFLSYGFRFLSAWLIVIFTIERYIGVCMPLKRRGRCTTTFARRAIGTITTLAVLVSAFKPALSGTRSQTWCGSRRNLVHINFVLDIVYSLSITAVPFIIITSLNLLIIRKLWQTRKRHKQSKFLTEENFVKLEFTFLLLVISTFFVALTIPFLIVWCMYVIRNFKLLFHQMSPAVTEFLPTTSTQKLKGMLRITKTIFYLNYSANFFLYSLTGAHFRRRLVSVLCPKRSKKPRSGLWDLFETRVASHASYNDSTTGFQTGRGYLQRASRASTLNKTQVTAFSASLRSSVANNCIKEEFL